MIQLKRHPRICSRVFRGIFIPCPRKDDTPKKVVRSEFFCFLCGCNLGKDQVRVFKKSAVDITRLIKRTLDVDVSLYSSSDLFICTAIFSHVQYCRHDTSGKILSTTCTSGQVVSTRQTELSSGNCISLVY